MCLAVPARITSIEGIRGIIDLEGVRREISLLLCPDATVGQYALVHAGFAIAVVDESEAQKSLDVFDEYRRMIRREAPTDDGQEARGDDHAPEDGADRPGGRHHSAAG